MSTCPRMFTNNPRPENKKDQLLQHLSSVIWDAEEGTGRGVIRGISRAGRKVHTTTCCPMSATCSRVRLITPHPFTVFDPATFRRACATKKSYAENTLHT